MTTPKELNRSFLLNNWVTIATAMITTGAILVGWAHGLLDLPDRLSRLEESQKPLSSLPARVETLETRVDSMEKKNQADHDLLIHIDAVLTQLQRDLEDGRRGNSK